MFHLSQQSWPKRAHDDISLTIFRSKTRKQKCQISRESKFFWTGSTLMGFKCRCVSQSMCTHLLILCFQFQAEDFIQVHSGEDGEAGSGSTSQWSNQKQQLFFLIILLILLWSCIGEIRSSAISRRDPEDSAAVWWGVQEERTVWKGASDWVHQQLWRLQTGLKTYTLTSLTSPLYLLPTYYISMWFQEFLGFTAGVSDRINRWLSRTKQPASAHIPVVSIPYDR